jgi:hypothetical protein
MILRIVTKVKMNVLLTSPPLMLVLLVPVTPKRMLVKVLILLGIGAPIILLIMMLKWIRRPLLLLLVFKLLSFSFLLIVV